MSLTIRDTPGSFQPSVAERDGEAEVAHCVGGVTSPLLLNVALHGLEAAAGVRYTPDGMRTSGRTVPGSPVVVRYADDLVALCGSAEQAAGSGRVPVPEARVVFTVKLPASLADRVRERARETGVTISALVTQALTEFLAPRRGKRPPG